ncbi:MAG: hypothetical protein LBL80_00810 [Ruminococcus sp.]|jgi:hypothetical protein|nr:hypothetical protein [Ruminococcus sp.]
MIVISLPEDIMLKAKAARTPEELLSLAAENNITLSPDEAASHYNRLHTSREATIEELENVVGGREVDRTNPCGWDCPKPGWEAYNPMVDKTHCKPCGYSRQDFYNGLVCEWPNYQG